MPARAAGSSNKASSAARTPAADFLFTKEIANFHINILEHARTKYVYTLGLSGSVVVWVR
jgi:hypothetical protein